MLRLLRTFSRRLALLAATVFTSSSLLFSPIGILPALAESGSGNGVNVILMIGDGMGWEMTRAASIAKGAPFYKSGKGSGLFMQQLEGYTYATTYGTTIPGTTPTNPTTAYNDSNSALDGSNPLTGASPVRPGFTFSPEFNPGTPARNLTAAASQPCRAGNSTSGGNLVGYEPAKGGPNPWTPISPAEADAKGYDRDYITCSYTDSANSATALYTGVKTYNNAMAVDIFEKPLETILQAASKLGKSTGVVTSVPITHATPGAAVSGVNRRSKYDEDYPALDDILQQALRPDLPQQPGYEGRLYLPTVMLGGGHPLDFQEAANAPGASTIVPKGFTYIKESTYNELHNNPDNNRYGYKFLERDIRVTDLSVKTKDIVNAGKQLLDVSKAIDPNQGQRLLGLYGARGQDGNIPTRGSTGDYSLTGLSNFSLYSSASASTAATGQPANNGTQIPTPDTVRPLVLGETPTNFIQRERKANPTLAQMTKAALNVLGKDKDGFWLMVEGGDIDWAAHDNNMEALIGNTIAFDNAVGETIQWIGKNGGWEKNVLIVTADHDHYLTINNNFPRLLDRFGAKDLTFTKHTPKTAGHFWGAYDEIKYGWGNHSNRPVPVYYQGEPLDLKQYIGKDFHQYGFTIPAAPEHVDQTQIYQAMLAALKG